MMERVLWAPVSSKCSLHVNILEPRNIRTNNTTLERVEEGTGEASFEDGNMSLFTNKARTGWTFRYMYLEHKHK